MINSSESVAKPGRGQTPSLSTRRGYTTHDPDGLAGLAGGGGAWMTDGTHSPVTVTEAGLEGGHWWVRPRHTILVRGDSQPPPQDVQTLCDMEFRRCGSRMK